MQDASAGYQFSSFLVGCILKRSIVERDDEIRSKFYLRGVDSVKTEITRELGKRFARKRLAVCEGRDQGLLFKNADIKFFFKCSLKIAAKRRFKEFRKTDKKITLKEVESAIKQRNYTDVTRAFMPLRIPPGAVIVSTSSISKKEMFRRISKTVERKLLLKYGRNYKARSR